MTKKDMTLAALGVALTASLAHSYLFTPETREPSASVAAFQESTTQRKDPLIAHQSESQTEAQAPIREPRPTAAPHEDWRATYNAYRMGELDAEAQLAFWDSIRNSPAFTQALRELEQEVSRNPNDATQRKDLAKMYLMKLLTLPDSPEKGIWANKAEQQWNAALELDPKDWEARKHIAVSLSQYPTFLNRQDDAIEHYEKLIELQSAQPEQPAFQNSYLELANLYLNKGDRPSARQTLDEGLALHPGSARLKSSKNALNE